MKNIFTVLAFLLVLSSCKLENKSNNENSSSVKDTIVKNNTKNNKMLKETTTFPSQDGLIITADIYRVDNNPITILLCHQAGFSRGEYKDTALLFNSYGYSVMAIDQRSGEAVNDVVNETAKRAKSKNLETDYIHAKPDIIAAINYLFDENGNEPLILVGSSYSATLAMLLANKNNKIKAVAAFSPGEYFKGRNIQNEIKDLKKTIFVTASLSETKDLTTLVSKMKKDNLTHFKPTEEGIHGSRVLWDSTKGFENYRKAFKEFLDNI